MVVVVDDGWGRGVELEGLLRRLELELGLLGFELGLGLLLHVVGGVDGTGKLVYTGAPAGCLGLESPLVRCLQCPRCHAELANGRRDFVVIAHADLVAEVLSGLLDA